MYISSNKLFCLIDIFPSLASSNEPEKIPALDDLFKFLDSEKFFGNNSSMFFQSFNFPKNSLILLIPSSVVKTGNFKLYCNLV